MKFGGALKKKSQKVDRSVPKIKKSKIQGGVQIFRSFPNVNVDFKRFS